MMSNDWWEGSELAVGWSHARFQHECEVMDCFRVKRGRGQRRNRRNGGAR